MSSVPRAGASTTWRTDPARFAERRVSLATLITTHGYWMLAVGCLLEGEIVLVLAALAAHRGYLTAFEAATGHMRWRFHTIPGPGEKVTRRGPAKAGDTVVAPPG